MALCFVNAAAMGISLKTGGADAATSVILDEMMVAKHNRSIGVQWKPDWILRAANAALFHYGNTPSTLV